MTERQRRAKERRESRERGERARAEVQRVVAGGKCPTCSGGLRRSLALDGWWQCEQFGAEGFRADPARPSCEWQGFTR